MSKKSKNKYRLKLNDKYYNFSKTINREKISKNRKKIKLKFLDVWRI